MGGLNIRAMAGGVWSASKLSGKLSTITRLCFATHAPLHLRVAGSIGFQTEEVAASVVFCRESFPRILGSPILPPSRLSNRPGGTSPRYDPFDGWYS